MRWPWTRKPTQRSVANPAARDQLRKALRHYMRGEVASCVFDDQLWEALDVDFQGDDSDSDLEEVTLGIVWLGYGDWDRKTIDLNDLGFDTYRRVYAWLATDLPAHMTGEFEPFSSEEDWMKHEHLAADVPPVNPPVVTPPLPKEARPLYKSFRLWRSERHRTTSETS